MTEFDLNDQLYAIVDLTFEIRMYVRKIKGYFCAECNIFTVDLVEIWFDVLFDTPTAMDDEEVLRWIDMFDKHKQCLSDFALSLENLKVAITSSNQLLVATSQKNAKQCYKNAKSSLSSCQEEIFEIIEDSNARQKSRAPTPDFF